MTSGQSNLSCYSDGLMGYQDPKHRIGWPKEGAKFIHYNARAELPAVGLLYLRPERDPQPASSKRWGLPGAEAG